MPFRGFLRSSGLPLQNLAGGFSQMISYDFVLNLRKPCSRPTPLKVKSIEPQNALAATSSSITYPEVETPGFCKPPPPETMKKRLGENSLASKRRKGDDFLPLQFLVPYV